jgi:hypothetical protein
VSIIGLGRVRHALGDGATEEQARRVYRLLREAGLLDPGTIRPELVGVAEIADRAGVSSPAVCQWKLPTPLATLKQGRVWALTDVEQQCAQFVAARERPRDLV